ncbi:uncharacterized protein LOC106648144 [Trichogramma pretiosum]|uniref:uncharacterized protein LOC106648144 n=1 Tax=Trichogramma pretiosum TaxID=7493 RepID=UPI000C71A7D0|nr:uncharacterized protein LOC106648144 [Trichogramma pretiosum]
MQSILKFAGLCLLMSSLIGNVPLVNSLRILGIFPLQGKSHFVMSEALMKGLAAKGHQVDVYGHFPLKKSIPNYTDYSLAGTLPAFANNMTYEFMESFSKRISMKQMLEIVGEPICDLLNLPIFQKLLKDPPKYDLVIVEIFMFNCYLGWGPYLKVPMIAVSTTTLFDWMNEALGNPWNLAAEPSSFSQSIPPMSFLERVDNFLFSNYLTLMYNYHMRVQDKYIEGAFGKGHPNAVDAMREISLVLINYNQALNGIKAFTPGVVPVAGLHITDREDPLPERVKKFMDESKDGFIYFSFGSMVRIETFPKHILHALYRSFEKIAPVRVLMKIAKPEDLPTGLPSNVITHNWLPQLQVLKHKNIKAFVTHGGTMGTQEAVYHAVPMIGIPLFGDQHINIKTYVKKNLAVYVNRHELTEETFTRAVREILTNPLYKESSEKYSKAFKDVPMKPLETAIYWVEYVARHGKNALRSPLSDMPWWQTSLLDIYVFLATILVLILIVIRVIWKSLAKLLSKKTAKSKKKQQRGLDCVVKMKFFLSCLVVLASILQWANGLRILGMFPLHGKSHFHMCGSIMRGMAERGHQVDVYSHFPRQSPIPNYTDYSLAGTLPALANNITWDYVSKVQSGVSIPRMLAFGGNPVCKLMGLPLLQNLIRNPPKDPPYDVVVVEPAFANCHMVWGRLLNVPMVVVSTTPNVFDWYNEPLGNPVNYASDPSVFARTVAPMSFLDKLHNMYLHLYVSWAMAYFSREQDALLKEYVGDGYPSVYDLQKDTALVLLNHNVALNGVKAQTSSIVSIGGVHVLDDDSTQLPKQVEKFLDESKNGFIYVSFGSMVRLETFPKPVIDAFYAMFKNIAPVRVLMKIAKPEELQPGLPSNVIVQTWLPQIKVLKHKNIKGFVTHGGLLGTMEAVYHEIPMVGVPLFGDQHLNLEVYVRKNVAIKLLLENINEKSLTESVKAMLENPIYKKSVRQVSKMMRDTPMKPMDTAAYWIEFVARHGKDALRSPLTDMPWWEASLWDVYTFILSIIFLLLYVIKLILGRFLALFKRNTELKKQRSTKVKRN